MIDEMIRRFKEYLENRDLRFDKDIEKTFISKNKHKERIYLTEIKFYEKIITFKDCEKLNHIANLFSCEICRIRTRFILPHEDCFISIVFRSKE